MSVSEGTVWARWTYRVCPQVHLQSLFFFLGPDLPSFYPFLFSQELYSPGHNCSLGMFLGSGAAKASELGRCRGWGLEGELGQTSRKSWMGAGGGVWEQHSESLTRYQVESEYMDVELAAASELRGGRLAGVMVMPRGSGGWDFFHFSIVVAYWLEQMDMISNVVWRGGMS